MVLNTYPEEFQPYADVLIKKTDELIRFWITEFIKQKQNGEHSNTTEDQIILLAGAQTGIDLMSFAQKHLIR